MGCEADGKRGCPNERANETARKSGACYRHSTLDFTSTSARLRRHGYHAFQNQLLPLPDPRRLERANKTKGSYGHTLCFMSARQQLCRLMLCGSGKWYKERLSQSVRINISISHLQIDLSTLPPLFTSICRPKAAPT